ncbi:MAG: acriflavine resistance protein B [Deltaproteobacteria bacterium RBG_16_71_12]|nr:MAG: acriflavine resistance protein B [Deltaproteobacteria bacterium RBG_16_71_12]
MNVSAIFIERPVATTLLVAAVIAFGVVGYRDLPVNDVPNVDFPSITVHASLPGASAETMAAAVATPLERQFSTIAGIDSMTSVSSLGSTSITLQFALSRDIDAAAQDVQAAIAGAARQLPPSMPSPPRYQKVNPASSPIVYIALTSPTLPLSQLNEYGETLMAQRISMVSGVAQVQVFGAQKYAVRVQLSPDALAARGLAVEDIAKAVQSANVNLPGGVLDGAHQALTIEAQGQLFKADDYQRLIVAWKNGAPVRLDELGRVSDGVENARAAAWLNFRVADGEGAGPNGDRMETSRAVVLAVQRQPGTNTIEVARSIQDLLPKLEEQLPASVSARVLFDRSASIEESVNDVQATLLVTLVLVVLVMFVFLRNVRATVIPSLALPLSLLGTFGVLSVMGYTIDNLSLMALTLSLGFVVDDAIVMLENIVRHMEKGEEPRAASLTGSKEIGFTIISMTISLSAVFIPVLFMGGVLGRLFREFAVTIGVAILISGVVSLTFTPMLASRLLSSKQHAATHDDGAPVGKQRLMTSVLSLYEKLLRVSIRHRVLVLLGSFAVLGITALMFASAPKGLFPTEDTGQLFAQTEALEGTSFEEMVRHQQAAAAIVATDPAVDAFMSSVGSRGGQASGTNTGVMFMRLKPRNQRPSSDEIINRLRPRLAQIPGIRVFLQVPPSIRLSGRLSKSEYQFTLQDADVDKLYTAAAALEQRLRGLPQLQDVSSDLQVKSPQVEVHLDRDRASAKGVTADAVETTLFNAFATRQVSTIYAPNNTYQVILELLPEMQQDMSALSRLYVKSSSGALVLLSDVATLKRVAAPLAINHSGQLPAVTLSFNLAPGSSLGDAVGLVQQAAAEVVPPTVGTSFQGSAQIFQSSTQGMGGLLLLAVLVIYLVLGILYESFIHPLTILSALPFAGFGALATLMVFGQDLSVYAFVGIIMLVGLVKKNGIMMVDFAIEEQKRGKSADDAIIEASLVRFRPIMMTTVAAMMGTLPIALGIGAGGETRRPLGLAVVGGLFFSQLLTLLVTPVFFVWMDTIRTRFAARAPHP